MRKISFMRNFPEKSPLKGRATDFIPRVIAGVNYGNVIPLVTLDSFSDNFFKEMPKMLTIREKQSYAKDSSYTAFAWEEKPYNSFHFNFAQIQICDVMPVAVFSAEIRYMINGRWQSREDWDVNLSLFDGFDNLCDFLAYHKGKEGYIFAWNFTKIENMLSGGLTELKKEAEARGLRHLR